MNQYLITPQELNTLLQNHEAIQLVDVRTPEKHAHYNIGGKLLPFDELAARFQELNLDLPIVVYCTSGGRSMMALQYLLSAGFENVRSLDGGVTAWKAVLEKCL